MAKEIVADRIKQLRLSAGLSQKAAAELLPTSERQWQQYEYGTRTPAYEKLIALANLFQCSTDFLCGLTDDPTRK